jgi:twitching motility protein PilJ
MAFKPPFSLFASAKKSVSGHSVFSTVLDLPAKSARPQMAASQRTKLPIIGDKPTEVQLRILGAAAAFFLVVLVLALWNEINAANHRSAHRGIAGEMRVFAQVVSKSAIRVTSQGAATDFAALQTGRARFEKLLGLLADGGEDEGFAYVPVDAELRPTVEKVGETWKDLDKGLTAVLAQEKPLRALSGAVAKTASASDFLGKTAADRPALQDIAKLSVDIARRARVVLMLPAPLHLQAVEVLKGNLADIAQRAEPVTKSLDGPARDTVEKALGDIRGAGAEIISSVGALDEAKAAAGRLQPQAEVLVGDTDKLFQAIGAQGEGRIAAVVVVIVSAALMVALLALMLSVFNDDMSVRREESERQRREAEASKDVTQEAILRLMNEMGDLADGDLTVRATVTEDVTGAIADSVNYTIEELSVLVKRINDAAGRLTTASEAAQRVSNELLGATRRQSGEIVGAGGQVREMARNMGAVSRRAGESVRVARQSLEAAQKGAQAVENSITGMNDIRQQIQETSKRIKRLGESSQEIGEIVELISDITEQTNVLALNAAIQAASAGEAGRGFSVVAEEVQRLAERSGEATKQIAAIVKTIQSDTQDAVSAMEHSTQDVVEGAKLSDAAGQALAEISDVSNNLAGLIEHISSDTQSQAQIATLVASSMEGILKITERTTSGTQQTAESIGELADLAVELKGSVAGFKV